MRQDSWLCRRLGKYAFIIYACNQCSQHYYARSAFAEHLVREHESKDPVLLRYVYADSDAAIGEWLHRSYPGGEAPSASS